MSLLVAVKSSTKDREEGRHDDVRNTWGAELKARGFILKFFLGGPFGQRVMGHAAGIAQNLKSDETTLDCPDNQDGEAFKIRAICAWAYDRKIDHLFLCDVNTEINVEKFLSIIYQRYDYAGKMSESPDGYSWAKGDYGYFLSRQTFGRVADGYPNSLAADTWVGQLLGKEIENGSLSILDLSFVDYSHSKIAVIS